MNRYQKKSLPLELAKTVSVGQRSSTGSMAPKADGIRSLYLEGGLWQRSYRNRLNDSAGVLQLTGVPHLYIPSRHDEPRKNQSLVSENHSMAAGPPSGKQNTGVIHLIPDLCVKV